MVDTSENTARMWQIVISLASLYNLNWLRCLWLRRRPLTRSLLACTIFVLVCAFRSFVPRVDAERLCFWDLGLVSIVSSPFVGRICATVAEIAFAYQITKVWLRVVTASGVNKRGAAIVANLAWFLCSFAQVLCWTGVLTTNNAWHAAENTLWGVSPFLLTVGTFLALSKSKAPPCDANRYFLQSFAVLGTGFVMFLALHDVPMYIQKWRDGVGGGTDLSFSDGLADSMRCVVSKDNEMWIPEMPWMTGYFVGGVILSLKLEECDTLLLGPAPRGNKKKA